MAVTTGYQNLLQSAQNDYAGILSGYAGALAGNRQAQAGIAKGYGQLSNQVLGDIQGVEASQRQGIADIYAQQSGGADQQLINSGLGNTTVRQSVQRGIGLDRAKADIALSNQTAQLRAGYRSQLGLAGLGYRGQAQHDNAAFQLAGLGYRGGWQNSRLSAGMHGAGIEAGQYGHGGGGAGGGGSYGAGGYGPAAANHGRSANPFDEPMIDFNAMNPYNVNSAILRNPGYNPLSGGGSYNTQPSINNYGGFEGGGWTDGNYAQAFDENTGMYSYE